jgi:hypothetical protein
MAARLNIILNATKLAVLSTIASTGCGPEHPRTAQAFRHYDMLKLMLGLDRIDADTAAAMLDALEPALTPAPVQMPTAEIYPFTRSHRTMAQVAAEEGPGAA